MADDVGAREVVAELLGERDQPRLGSSALEGWIILVVDVRPVLFKS